MARHHRHEDVEDDRIGSEFGCERNRLRPVCRLADDLETPVEYEERPGQGTDVVLVIDY
jgi:hypothetical protein